MLDPKTGTVYVDNTTLRAVAECETQVALRHALDYTVQEDAHQLNCGIAVHEVMADYLAGASPEHCLLKYQLLWQPQSEEAGLDRDDHPLFRLSYTNTAKILGEYLETHPVGSFPFSVRPGLVEVGFQFPLNDECVCGAPEHHHPYHLCREFRHAFVFWGRIDAIVQAQHDNSLYVLDHKTTGRLTQYKIDQYRMDSQMSGYTWAAQKSLGQRVAGIFINAIEFSKLPSDPVRKCRTHGVVYAECGPRHMNAQLLIYQRTQDQLDTWQRDAVRLARKYRALVKNIDGNLDNLARMSMDGTFHGACGFCSFQKFCQSGRPLHYTSGMLVKQPWRPFTPQEETSE